MKDWAAANRMKINPTKSGILRILNRRGKVKRSPNELDIPEVGSYRYLGVMINQAISPKEHIKTLRSIEKKLTKRICISKPSLVTTKSRYLLYKTIIRANFCYAAYII